MTRLNPVNVRASFLALTITMLSACNFLLDDIERRAVDVVRELAAEKVDVEMLAKTAGWPVGTDPRSLLENSGPHVSLVYIRNMQRQGATLHHSVQASTMDNDGKRQEVVVSVRESGSRTATVVATLTLQFRLQDSGSWKLASIATDSR